MSPVCRIQYKIKHLSVESYPLSLFGLFCLSTYDPCGSSTLDIVKSKFLSDSKI